MNTHARAIVIVFSMCCFGAGFAHERLPAIVATYSQAGEESSSEPVTWELRRGADCVLATNGKSGISERWQRDEEGRVWYRRIFHSEEKIVEYQPTDLRLGNVDREWTRIASILDPEVLQTLELQAHRPQLHGRNASVYRGTRDGESWEVWWLAVEEIPARVRISTAAGASVLQLVKLDLVEFDSAICDAPSTAHFESIDFADLGDRHGDPIIESMLKRQGSLGHKH